MTPERLKEIKADCEEAKKLWRHVAPSKIFECIAEIERLRELVENAFFEALHYANPDALNPDQQAWVGSEARKALEAV